MQMESVCIFFVFFFRPPSSAQVQDPSGGQTNNDQVPNGMGVSN